MKRPAAARACHWQRHGTSNSLSIIIFKFRVESPPLGPPEWADQPSAYNVQRRKARKQPVPHVEDDTMPAAAPPGRAGRTRVTTGTGKPEGFVTFLLASARHILQCRGHGHGPWHGGTVTVPGPAARVTVQLESRHGVAALGRVIQSDGDRHNHHDFLNFSVNGEVKTCSF